MSTNPKFVYFDGEIIPYEDAKLHFLTPAVKYGYNVFEGVRAYWNEDHKESYLFRIDEHLERLVDSAKIAQMSLPNSPEEIKEILKELLDKNNLRQGVHIRISLFVKGNNAMYDAVDSIGLSIATMPRASVDNTEQTPLNVGVSNWQRISDNVMPARVKAGANYFNGRLALLQGRAGGYDNVIQLDTNGHVSEGPGQNFFIVKKGVVLTPPVTSSILEGITRETYIHLLKEVHGLEVEERPIDKSELYIADEAFYCGTGVEVMPVGSIDGYTVGNGSKGSVTSKLAKTYFDIVHGDNNDYRHWLTPVFG